MNSSQNGWPLIWDSSLLDRSAVTGTNRVLELRGGAVRTVFDYLCSQFHQRVESIEESERDDWGWAPPIPIPGSTDFSNHGSGTAVDLNATRHPWGVRGTFTTSQVAEIHTILGELDGVVRWGGDYTGKVDEMHFEINAGATAVKEVADRIRTGSPSPGTVLANQSLAPGCTGPAVKALQVRLNRDYPLYSHLTEDGIFGPATETVVRAGARQSRERYPLTCGFSTG